LSETAQNPSGFVRVTHNFTQISPKVKMARDRSKWLAELSTAFRRHRQHRTGWFVELHGERLRVSSSELPPRPGEISDEAPKRRSDTLSTPPGPATAAAALAEACGLFDSVMAGTWASPDPDALPAEGEEGQLATATLKRLVERLRGSLVGERIGLSTWQRTYNPYLTRLIEAASQRV
jgi:hypothetical protein